MFTIHPQLNIKQEGKNSLPPLSQIITSSLPFQQQQAHPQMQQPISQLALPAQHLLPHQHIQRQPGYPDSQLKQDKDLAQSLPSKSPIEAHQSPPASPKYSSKQPTDRCSCKHEGNHIPRPRNAFILFRQQHHQSVLDEGNVVKTNPDVSRELGKRWRDLSPQEKDYWNKLAEEEKKKHAEKYPGYRYIPRRFGKKGSCPYCKNKALLKQQQAQQQQMQLQQLHQQKTAAKQTPVPSLSSTASSTPDDTRKPYSNPPFGAPSSDEHAVAQSFLSLRNQPYFQHPQQHQISAPPYYQYSQSPGNSYYQGPHTLTPQTPYQYHQQAPVVQPLSAPFEPAKAAATELPSLKYLAESRGVASAHVEEKKSCSIASFLN